jgi:DNA-binding response OmpR family regulator
MSSPAPPRRVLAVEDDPAIRELMRLHLALAGLHVEEAADGREALARARAEAFDLIVLDVMLPTLDGITVCRAIRSEGANRDTPILIVTARDTEADTVIGLESGADDYLAKPFGVREFVARVGAVMRRTRPADAAGEHQGRVIASRGLTLDPARRRATVRGREVDLTRHEFDILYLFASRPGIVFSRTALLARVWPGDTYVTERTVDTVVSRVRRKVERDSQDPELILTARGVGYKFADVD